MFVPNFKRFEEIAYGLLNKRYSRTFHTAFIFKRNEILSVGLNSPKTHPINKRFKYPYGQLHAEMSSVIKLGQMDCTGLSLAVLRIDMNDKLNMSRPCPACSQLIDALNFKSVFYTNELGVWTKR